MEEVQIQLAFIWIAVMLTYLLGDVLRIFSTGITPGEIEGKPVTQTVWLGIAALMVMPIVMIVLSILLDQPINRVANIIVAGFFFIFNLVGLPTFPQPFDKFLLIVSMVFNLLTIWYAWNWI